VFPFAAMLVAVWDTVAMTAGQRRREVSVQFSDVKFHSQPPVYDQQLLNLTVAVQRGSGRFEVRILVRLFDYEDKQDFDSVALTL
jgi:hypothetical protein